MDKPAFDHLFVIRASGTDAVAFLQGQLSNDFALLPNHQWQLAAYCSAKGRMLASFWGLKLASDATHQDVVLVLSKDIGAATLKRLSMFVLRAKVKLEDASQMLPELFATYGLAAWSEHEVTRGVARITQPLVDLFVPQMLNYESIGGVSFKKGCYPGQEVVARSQFRGAIKRRTYLVNAPKAMHDQDLMPIGGEIFASDSEEGVGVLVQTQVSKSAGIDALICIQTSSAEADLRVGSKDGLALVMCALPYALRNDI